MIGRIPRWLLTVGIVTTASACDNVSWGGVQVGLQGPSVDSLPAAAEGPEAGEAPPAPLELGPLLYAGFREGDSARIQPVAELGSDGLRPLPAGEEGESLSRRILDARLRPGTELTLFHQGVRIGTLVVGGEGGVSRAGCAARPEVRGHLELVPGAVDAQRFLALEEGRGKDRPIRPFRTLRDQYDHRVASLSLGAEAVSRAGAPWPPSLLEIRRDIQLLEIPGLGAPAIMATFLYQDRMGIGPAPDEAYSLLVLGEPSGSDYSLAYAWYRPAGVQGKGAPRLFSHLDWDGDGETEILLEVFGEAHRWWAALEPGPEGWRLAFQDPCGAPGGGR